MVAALVADLAVWVPALQCLPRFVARRIVAVGFVSGEIEGDGIALLTLMFANAMRFGVRVRVERASEDGQG